MKNSLWANAVRVDKAFGRMTFVGYIGDACRPSVGAPSKSSLAVYVLNVYFYDNPNIVQPRDLRNSIYTYNQKKKLTICYVHSLGKKQ